VEGEIAANDADHITFHMTRLTHGPDIHYLKILCQFCGVISIAKSIQTWHVRVRKLIRWCEPEDMRILRSVRFILLKVTLFTSAKRYT
jgi:hypothetical protein